MNRSSLVIVGLLLLGGVILLISGEDGSTEASHTGEPQLAVGSSTRSGGGARTHRSRRTSRPTIDRLRALLKGESMEHSFSWLQERVGELDDDQIQSLLEEVGMESPKGIEGWLRVALYAEWARRDPVAALAASSLDKVGDRPLQWQEQQTIYGVFLGWSSVSPQDALQTLMSNVADADQYNAHAPYWPDQAYREVIHQLALRDREAAWKAMPSNSYRKQAMRGFFETFEDFDEALNYANQWAASYVPPKPPSEVSTIGLSQGFSASLSIDQNEFIASNIGASLIRLDLDRAEQWMKDNREGQTTGRWSNALQQWAAVYPADALEAYRANPEREGHDALARGIIRGDTALAADLAHLLRGQSQAARTWMNTLTGMGNYNVLDYFPGSKQQNHLPNFEKEYNDLLHATAPLEDTAQNGSLRNMLHRTFSGHVPAAKEIWERIIPK